MQPSSTQTSPAGQAASPVPHSGTQCWSTHVVPVAQVMPPSAEPQGVGLPVHTPVLEPLGPPSPGNTHEYPEGQGCVALHPGMHAPFTHCSPLGHCVASEH